MPVRSIVTAAGLLVLLCFCCCSDSPANGGHSTAGMPNSIGMLWVYEVYDSLTQATDTEMVSITDTVVDEQSSKYLLWRFLNTSTGIVQDKLGAAIGDTFAYFTTAGDKITLPLTLERYVFPLTAGKEWYNGLFAGSSKVLDVVTLSVPARTFHDVAVVEHSDSLNGSTNRVTTWVVAGTGMIARHEYGITTTQLNVHVVANKTWRLLRYDLGVFPLKRFPMNPGTRWTYRVTDSNHRVSDTVTVTIGRRVATTRLDSAFVWHIVRRNFEDSVMMGAYTAGGHDILTSCVVPSNSPCWDFVFPLAVGRYWHLPFDPPLPGIDDKSPVSILAGNVVTGFHDIHFEGDWNRPLLVESWLVPGVGIAARRFNTPDGDGWRLQEEWTLVRFSPK